MKKDGRDLKGGENDCQQSTQYQKAQGLRDGEGDVEQRERRGQVVLAHEQRDRGCLGRREELGDE